MLSMSALDTNSWRYVYACMRNLSFSFIIVIMFSDIFIIIVDIFYHYSCCRHDYNI